VPLPEKALIAQIRRMAVPRGGASKVLAGIGDDCAVLRLRQGHDSLVTTDFSLEGIHFRRDWHPPESVGHRCLARGLSDIAAMGGEPLAAFLSLALPRDLPPTWVSRFMRGLLTLAKKHRLTLAGGDTAESPNGVLADIVVVGSVPKSKAVLRSRARPGDHIYVSGALGGSAAVHQFEALRHPERPRFYERAEGSRVKRIRSDRNEIEGAPPLSRPARQSPPRASDASRGGGDFDFRSSGNNPTPRTYPRHFYPEPRLELGRILRERRLATAMIDTSDGLSTDLAHICEESSVGAEVSAELIPRARVGKPALKVPLELALHGGEDYELLFTAPASRRIPPHIAGVPLTHVGVITRTPGLFLRDADGASHHLAARGWEHFRH
jgi:thiamine-monophosphate kinase